MDKETVRAELPVLWRLARNITHLLAEACSDTHSGTVAEIHYNEQRTNIDGFSFKNPPYAVLELLTLIRSEDGLPSWKIRHEVLCRESPPELA